MNTPHSCQLRRRRCLLAPLALLAASSARSRAPAWPEQNMTVRVRVVAAAEASAGTTPPAAQRPPDYTVSTRRAADDPSAPLSLSVVNGRWAMLRLARSVPVRWLQAAASAGAAGPASGAGRGAGPGGAVVNAVTWMEAGQGLAVRVRWPGGPRPAIVELRFDRAAIEPSEGDALPAANRARAGTTLSVPLGRWVSFAVVGADAAPAEATDGGHDVRWATADSGSGRQVMQVQVSMP